MYYAEFEPLLIHADTAITVRIKSFVVLFIVQVFYKCYLFSYIPFPSVM